MSNSTLSGERGWLREDAAVSIRRIDAALGDELQITSAGRTRERQQYLYDGWRKGLPGFQYAAKPGTSPHETGRAIDSDEAQQHIALMAEHGWHRPLDSEPWHFLYRLADDQRRNDPTPTNINTITTGDDMIIRIQGKAGKRRGGLYLIQGGKATFLGSDPGQGFPLITDEGQIAALQKRVKGIG